MIIVDASAIVDFLLDRAPAADAVLEWAEGAGPLAAPHLIDAEVGQVMRRFVLNGELAAERARDALADLRDLHIIRYEHIPLLERAFELRDNATIYDALYLALAEATTSVFLTCDAALAAVPGHARVEVVG